VINIIIEIWGDGASSGMANAPGGWGAVIKIDGEFHHQLGGGDLSTTNNIMEMKAIMCGIESVLTMLTILNDPKGHDIEVISDSRYVVGPFKEKWISKWRSYEWRKSMNSAIMRPNAELWKEFDNLVMAISDGNAITWRQVKGHIGIVENEMCDQIAGVEKEKFRLLASNIKIAKLLEEL